jgi:toluene monooxygenase system protein B
MGEILPLVCSFEDGCILTLVPLDTDLTMDEAAASIAEHFAGRMLPRRDDAPMRVRRQGDEQFLPRDMRIRDAGWALFDTIQVGYETPVAPQQRRAVRG